MTFLGALVLTLVAGLLALNQSRKAIDDERQQAEKNFHNSLNIMQQSLESLDRQIEQAPMPGMQPFQKELLQRQLNQYERYPPEYRSDERMQQSLAQAYYRLGKVSQDIGTQPGAIEVLTKSRTLYQSFSAPADNPGLYHDRIARCHFSIGQVYLSMGEPTAALEPLRQSIAISEPEFTQKLDQAKGFKSNEMIVTRTWTYRELLAWQLTYLAIAESRTGRVGRPSASWNEPGSTSRNS